MSSDRPSGDRSSAHSASHGDLAGLVATRGAPLIEALETHVPGAAEHAEATAAYSFAAAVELGFERARCETAREAAKLHDVGRVYVPAELLTKPNEALTETERETIESHHEAGARLVRGAGIPELVCEWILHARERFDGRGPDGMVAVQIPVESRIIRAACTCDRLLSAPEASNDHRRFAIEGLRQRAGHELDPRMVDALIAVLTRAQG
jgi:putative nucleotidyltransferase with HDIG domain